MATNRNNFNFPKPVITPSGIFTAPNDDPAPVVPFVDPPRTGSGLFKSKITKLTTELPRLYILPEIYNRISLENSVIRHNIPLRYLGNNLFKVDKIPVDADETISIVGYDFEQNVRFGVTTDTALSNYPGTRIFDFVSNGYSEVYWISSTVAHLSIGDNGFIFMPGLNISPNLKYFITYTHKIDEKYIPRLDLNPATNASIIGKKVVFLLRPTFRFTDPHDQCLHYLIVEDKVVTTSTYWNISTGVNYDGPFALEDSLSNFGVKVIAELTPYSAYDVSASKFADARLSANVTAVNDLDDKANSIFDAGYFDGEPIFGNYLYYCKISPSILKDNSGPLYQQDIQGLIKKHLPTGSYVEFEYSDAAPFVSGTWNNGGVDLSWPDQGRMAFNVYYRSDGNDFALVTTVYSNGGTNAYTVSNLNPYSIHEFYVTALVYDIEGTPSNVVTIAGPNTEII
jgi:hypothetical protein